MSNIVGRCLAMTDVKAETWLRGWRWPDGVPVCHRCGRTGSYFIGVRQHGSHVYRCRSCRHDFTALASTPFANGKARLQIYVAALECWKANVTAARPFSQFVGINQRAAAMMFYRMQGALVGRPSPAPAP